MGKQLIIKGADFSNSGFRTANIVDVILKAGGTNPFNFYFLPTALTYNDNADTLPDLPVDAVTKTVNEDGVVEINSAYAAFLFGKKNGDSADITIDELVMSYNKGNIADINTAFNNFNCNLLDLRGVNFANGVNISKMFLSATIGQLKMPDIHARVARKAFYNFSKNNLTANHSFSFIKEITSDLTSTFEYLKGATADFSGINVSQATLFNSTFKTCNLAEIDLSSWHFDSMEWCAEMFRGALASVIHLDNWSKTISSSSKYSNMFTGTTNLTTVYVTNCTSTVKTWLLARLNEVSAGGSSNWTESTIGGKAVLVKGS